jgi:hypothetical protein
MNADNVRTNSTMNDITTRDSTMLKPGRPGGRGGLSGAFFNAYNLD